MSFISYLINGISLGSVYAIIALGYTMVYGIAKMLNFAHGDIIMVGGYAAFISMNSLGVNPILAVILSVVICTILGLVIERVAYRPLRNASSPLAVLITAIGVSYLLQNLALLMFGADTKSFTSVVCTGVSLAKIHKWSRLQFLMLKCKSWFETVHIRGTNENTICLCRKGIYELMVESSSTTMDLI